VKMTLIQQAKNSNRLVDYLISILGEPVVKGNIPRWHGCPSCGESSHANFKLQLMGDEGQYFRCWKCNAKGDVVQAAQLYLNLNSAVDAARSLLSNEIKPVYQGKIYVSPDGRNAAITECLLKIFEATEKTSNQFAIDYLLHTRMLPMPLVVSAIKQGLIRFFPNNPSESISLIKKACGEELLRESGIWLKNSKAPGIAFRPLMFFFPDHDSAEFRSIKPVRSNEPKVIRYGITNKPWSWAGSGDSHAFTEGFIDMLSMVALDYKGTVHGIPGCNTWNDIKKTWLSGMNLKGKKSFVCFDNDTDSPDNPGQTWAVELVKELSLLGSEPVNRVPKPGMDVNEILIEKLSKLAVKL